MTDVEEYLILSARKLQILKLAIQNPPGGLRRAIWADFRQLGGVQQKIPRNSVSLQFATEVSGAFQQAEQLQNFSKLPITKLERRGGLPPRLSSSRSHRSPSFQLVKGLL